MDTFLLRIFQRQVADQCRFTLASVPMINEAVRSGDDDALWIGCQMFIVGAANASKALWGEGKKRPIIAPTRQHLRDSLGVTDSSPLYDVGMRNNFEHYDERIDRWWAESQTQNHLDRYVGSPAAISGLKDIEQFRIFDPSTARIIFWGQSFDLQPAATECDRLLPIAERESSRPHWDSP